MMLEITQYTTSPAWNVQANTTTMIGMNCITRFIVAAWPVAVLDAIIRAWISWNAPASNASTEI